MAEGKRNYPKDRKSRRGYAARHPNGELTRIPQGGARNTRSVQIRVKHSSAKLEHARLDKRTWAGRVYIATCKDLVAHLGGDPTAPQSLLIDHAARLRIALDIAWGAAMQEGLDKEGPAFNNFLRALKNQRDTLNLLGLERRARPLNLSDYLQEKTTHELA